MDEREARRHARTQWSAAVYGENEAERAADDDALFWDAIPVDERAQVVWELSWDQYGLAEGEGAREARVDRSAALASQG